MGRRRNQKRMTARRRRRAIVLCGLLLGIGLIIFGGSYLLLYRYVHQVSKDEICAGVFIGDVDVSGMKAKEAETAILDQQKIYNSKKLTLYVDDERAESTFDEFGVAIKDRDKLIKEAVDYGKKGSMWKRYRLMKKLKKEDKVIPVTYRIDKEATEAILNERCVPLGVPASEATITRDGDEFVITEEQPGTTVNMEESLTKIKKFLNTKWDGEDGEIKLAMKVDKPRVTKEELETIEDKLGSYTTNCGTGGGRVQNIESGAGHMNGDVILPGEEYSANAQMEPYTEENGYTMAGSYENGEVVQSMGGGICQVSTTLYNAVILAELEITQRQPHSMTVNYVEPSMDAAIAGDYKDLKFQNNYDTPVYIESIIWGGKITFNIYGKETRPENRTIEFVSETISTEEPKKKYVEDGSASLGALSKSGSSNMGKTARLWKVVYEDGKEVSRDIFNNSTYNSSTITVSVGTASDYAEAAGVVRAAIGSQDQAQIEAAIAKANQIIAEAKAAAATPPTTETNEGTEAAPAGQADAETPAE